MSGICSAHLTHDPNCPACTALPLTEEQKHFYAGAEFAMKQLKRNGWHPVENCVLDAYEELEAAARKILVSNDLVLVRELEALDKLRELNRGFAPSKEERYPKEEVNG